MHAVRAPRNIVLRSPTLRPRPRGGAMSRATTTASTLGLGVGSTAGALVTPAAVMSSSWRVALGLWATTALLAQQVWQRTPGEFVSPRTAPVVAPASALTIHFGLISTVTFLVMG